MNLFGVKESIKEPTKEPTKEPVAPAFLESVSGEELAAIIREMGFGAEAAQDQQGDPLVRVHVEGYKTHVFFYATSEGRGRSLQFFAGFTDAFPLERVNEWNRKKRFAKAQADDGVGISFDVDLYGGVRREFLAEAVKRWRSLVIDFVTFMRT